MKKYDSMTKVVIITVVLIAISVSITYFVFQEKYQKDYDTKISEINKSYQNNISLLNSSQIDFIKEYSIALNDIHVGSSYSDMANVNLHKFNEYVSPNGTGYIYTAAIPLIDLAKDQATKSKDYLNKAKIKLEKIKDSAPSEFFKEDISNRIEQTDLLIVYSNQTYSLSDYAKQELYEINYGSQTNATDLWNKYNALVIEFNNNLKPLSDVQNKIDISWDQDWYPTLQEAVK